MEFEKLKQVIAEVLSLDPEEITTETTFVEDLGADSLDVVELAMSMEDEFSLPELGEEEIKSIQTVGDLVAYVSKAMG